MLSGQSVYAVFNADLTRQRNTTTAKAGALLPKGQFRIGKRSHFYKFWMGTGLPFSPAVGGYAPITWGSYVTSW